MLSSWRHKSKCSLIWDSTTSLWQTGQLTVMLWLDELLEFWAAATGCEPRSGSFPPLCVFSFLMKNLSKSVLSSSLGRLLGSSFLVPLASWDAHVDPTAFKEFLRAVLAEEAFLSELEETEFLPMSPTVTLFRGDPVILLKAFWLAVDTLGK